ncbi:response regulator [Leptospira sp. GIMC2001]|uniref:response regulator n=1 Tax=Leptospira sp. GIMC2001 TaxID=1513297 RepID=UPI002349F1C0|nr:response regulator [Leptospira sp. GIMC2001]WCL49400.1 response regulator [Leptospira sp. GIMC2001]
MQKVFKILLAEDDDNSAKVVIHSLDRYNFDVTHVADGMAALSKVRVNEYDLIISDIMMPYLDGLAFLEKAAEFIKETPTIVLTAAGERKNVLRAAQRQVSHYILKPIDVDGLMEKVLSTLTISKGELVEKRGFPLKISLNDGAAPSITLNLEGCPRKNSADEIAARVMDYIQARSTTSAMEINIQDVFFAESASFRILDEFLNKINKNTNLRSGQIQIFADEIIQAKLEPDKFPNLLSCKIQSRA